MGILRPVMASITISRDDLRLFSASITRLLAALGESKNRAGDGLLTSDAGWVEERFLLPGIPLGSDEVLCPSCRIRAAAQGAVCFVCEADTQRGRLLPGSRLVAFYADRTGASEAPSGSYYLASEENGLPAPMVLAFDMDGRPAGTPDVPVIPAYRARHVPRGPDGDVVTFEEIAARSHGRQALGYLKVDVDNLGFIFSRGLVGGSGDRASISRVATLSRTLEVFFAGHLEVLLRTEYPDVYLVYSGGDDLLAVGPWDVMFGLADRVRSDFRPLQPEGDARAVPIRHQHLVLLCRQSMIR